METPVPCQTCQHTMHNLGLQSSTRTLFWCPRCGTLKSESGPAGSDHLVHDSQPPYLVGHALDLIAALDDGHRLVGAAYLAKRSVREAVTGKPDRD